MEELDAVIFWLSGIVVGMVVTVLSIPFFMLSPAWNGFYVVGTAMTICGLIIVCLAMLGAVWEALKI